MSSLTLYWLFVVLDIGHLARGFLVVSIIAILGIGLLYTFIVSESYAKLNKGEKRILKGCKKIIKAMGILCVVCVVLHIFIPSEKQVAAIYLLPSITQSKIVKKLPDYAQEFLDLEIKKMEKGK